MRSTWSSRSTRSTSSSRATTASRSRAAPLAEPTGSGSAGGGPDGDAARPVRHGHDLRETVVASEVVYAGGYLALRLDTVERSDGTRARREVVDHPGAIAVVALDPEDRVLLVRQWRTPAGRAMLEIPAGTLDRGPDGSIEPHAEAARRELEEETGYRAGTWRYLAGFWTAPGFAAELMHLYLATDLVPADGDQLGPDEDERLLLEHLPWEEAVRAATEGEIVDAKSILGLLWLARLKASGQA